MLSFYSGRRVLLIEDGRLLLFSYRGDIQNINFRMSRWHMPQQRRSYIIEVMGSCTPDPFEKPLNCYAYV